MRSLLLAAALALTFPPRAERVYVDGAQSQSVRYEGKRWEKIGQSLEMGGRGNALFPTDQLLDGDFTVRVRLSLQDINSTEASLILGDSTLWLDGQGKQIALEGRITGGKRQVLGDAVRLLKPSRAFDLELKREGNALQLRIDGKAAGGPIAASGHIGTFGIAPGLNRIRLYRFAADGAVGKRAPIGLADVAKIQPDIDRAIDRGVDWLLKEQLRDGSWSTRQGMFLGGQTALCAYTLLKCGLPTTHPAVVRAFRFLDGVDPGETYSISLMLMAYEATHDVANQPRIRKLLDGLLKLPKDGLISYPNKWGPDDTFLDEAEVPDLSNQQFAALGMWAAHKAGVEAPLEAWRQMAFAIRLYQEREKLIEAPMEGGKTGTGKIGIAGFGYRNRNNPYGSMTAAGTSALKVCVNALEKTLTATERRDLDLAIDRGVGWLAQHISFERNPGTDDQAHFYYYLYAIERVGSFLGIDHIGEHAWYFEGARNILSKQSADWGNWASYYAQADTCFALLFLKRASSPVLTGGDGAKIKDLYLCETASSPVHFRAQGTQTIQLALTGFSEEVKKTWGAGKLGGLRVAAVEYLLDGEPIARVNGDPTRAWKEFRHAASYTFTKKGTFKLSAKAHLVDPEAPAEERNPTIALQSEPVTIRVQSALEPWMTDAAAHRTRNLLIGQRVTATSSSDANEGETAKRAVDGHESTRWVAAVSDRCPTLFLELSAPIKANAVTFTSGAVNEWIYGRYDRTQKIEIRVNGEKKPTVLAECEPDERKPFVVHLPKTLAISRLEIRIVERAPGGMWKGHASFAEVGLELRKIEAAQK